MSTAQPIATGTFGKTPLLHVLMSLLERSATGTLVIETPTATRSALVLDRGVPTKMRLGEPGVRLGEVLADMGYVGRDTAKSTYEKAAQVGELHGQVLVDAGVLDRESLEAALRTQLVKKMQFAAAFPAETVFGFYEGTDYLARWRSGPTPVSPLVAAWVLGRSRADANVVATMVHRVADFPLRLHPQAQPRAFGFERAEMALIDTLRARPHALEALNRLGIVPSHTLERVVYVLTLTRHLDFGRKLMPLGLGIVSQREECLLAPKESLRPSRPVVLGVGHVTSDGRTQDVPSVSLDAPAKENTIQTALDQLEGLSSAVKDPTPRAPGTAPLDAAGLTRDTLTSTRTSASSRAAAPVPAGAGASGSTNSTATPEALQKERRAQIERIAQGISTLDHFEFLGVSRDATAQTAQDAFLRLAKLYHPDRLPEELADLKPLATKIFTRLSEAHQTLSDPTKRQSYVLDKKHPDGTDEDEKVRRILRAAGAFQKAEVLFKKRMLAAAELEVNRALEDDPEQPDYRALFAWIQACKSDSEPRLGELLKMVSDAVTRNPASEKNRFYRVQILKRLGRVDEAVADCRIIVERNPHHVDAQREIRLWEMRRAPQKAGGARPGPTSKLSSTGTRSDPPSNGPPGRRSQPPPPGGLLGRLFKR